MREDASRPPLIGVTSSRGGGRYMWWFYWLAMRMFRVRPVRLVAPIERLEPDRFDGLIIGGGDDISADLYDGAPMLDVRIDPERDALERALLAHSASRATPVLGVCRGAQMLNVFHGGSLHQELHEVYPHHPRIWTPLPRKRVALSEGSGLARRMRRETVVVNSLHHQAIDRIGAGLEVVGRDEYGVVQAIEHPGRAFRVGVQWHPEFLIFQRAQRRLFEGFVEAARAYAARPDRAEPAPAPRRATELDR